MIENKIMHIFQIICQCPVANYYKLHLKGEKLKKIQFSKYGMLTLGC